MICIDVYNGNIMHFYCNPKIDFKHQIVSFGVFEFDVISFLLRYFEEKIGIKNCILKKNLNCTNG